MVKKAYNQTLLIKENGRAYYRSYDNGEITQANQALPLCFGMVPKECVKSVQAELLALCTDSHLKCGEIGLVYILRALSEMNQHEKIHEMIMKKDHPSYLRFINNNETTLPEFWRDDARSRNHDIRRSARYSYNLVLVKSVRRTRSHRMKFCVQRGLGALPSTSSLWRNG